MNSSMIKAVMMLVASAVSDRPLTEAEKALVETEKPKNLLIIADEHKMLPVVVQAMISNGLLDVQTELGAKAKKMQISSIFRIQGLEFEFERICDALEKAETDFIPLKGSVLRRLYPEPWMRTSADIDVLVTPQQLQKACEVLSKLDGYSLESEGSHDVKFLTQNGVYLELHFDLMEDSVGEGFSSVLKNAWNYAESVEGCVHHKAFRNEFFLLYHIVHMAKHFLSGGCGIRPFVDLLLMKKHYDFDEKLLSQMLKESGVLQFYNTCCELCEVWFNGAQHTDLTERLEQYVVSGGVFGTYKNGAAVKISQGKQKSKFKKFLNVAFLPTENMKMVYPNLKKRPWLLPFYHIKRWFRVFDRSKRDTVNSIVTAGDNLTHEEAFAIAQLLDELDIK